MLQKQETCSDQKFMSNQESNGRKRLDGPNQQVNRKKQKTMSPEVSVRLEIQMAAKEGSFDKALAAYNKAKESGIKLSSDSFATLLFLCSGGEEWEEALDKNLEADESAPREHGNNTFESKASESKELKINTSKLQKHYEMGHALLNDMMSLNMEPNEICFTALARLEALSGNPDEALEFAKKVVDSTHLTPKIRCFVPALAAYALAGNATGAFQTAKLARNADLQLGELEYGRLLQAACGNGVEWSQVEEVIWSISNELARLEHITIERLHKLFESPIASEAFQGEEKAADQQSKFRKWKITQCEVDSEGNCSPYGGQLKAIDLEDEEYIQFKNAVAQLAQKQERNKNDFRNFVTWLEENGPFELVIDAANVAFYGQNFETGGFSFDQVHSILQRLGKDHSELNPLVVLHVNRTKQPAAQTGSAKKLLAQWKDEKRFYAVPHGSNDDWYWLYAAIAGGPNALIVSNDEMRDHIFHLLSPRFFKRWKERHQLRYHFGGNPSKLELYFPSSYTACVQKLETGAWVFPCVDNSWSAAIPC